MDWKTCKMAALAKMFGVRQGEIETDEGLNKDLLAAMPYAATEAMHRICDAGVPLRRVVEFVVGGKGAQMLDLRKITPDFKSEGSCLQVMHKKDGTLEPIDKAQLYLGRFLMLPVGTEGTICFGYDAWPEEITPETEDDFDLPLQPDANALVPLYIAGSLYKDEEPALATIFMNEFESRLDDLAAVMDDRRAASFASVTGWCEE